MDMQIYTLHVVPIIVILYGTFVLFIHPPFRVIGATLIGGLAMALLNCIADVIAIRLSLWHYHASGLIAQLPLPLYTTSIFVTGGLAYLLIWRNWRSSSHWFALLLLSGMPILGFLRDLWQGSLDTGNSFLIWDSPLAWIADLALWIVMFFAGYLLFSRLAPPRQIVEHNSAEAPEETQPAVEKQP